MSNSPFLSADDSLQPVALLVATTWWSAPAKLAIALAHHGCRVEVVCPPDHPFLFMDRVAQVYPYRSFDTVGSLSRAIELSQPTILIPCDDGAVWQLHELHQREPELRALIETSIGAAEGYKVSPSRGDLMAAANRLGVRTPDTVTISSVAQLREWFSQPMAAGVLKLDRSFGGRAVRIVSSLPEAEAAYTALQRTTSLPAAWVRWLTIHDVLAFWNRKHHTQRVVTLQRFVAGNPANTMLVCREGKVLAALTVSVLSTDGPAGSALMVRVIENTEILSAAEKIAAEFQLSGFHGLDFMLEEGTGRAYLIEWNARCTQLGHLNPAAQGDLASVFCKEFLGLPQRHREAGIAEETIAFFPQALLSHKWPFSGGPTFLDVPWEEPRLVRELIRRDWRERRLIGRILLRLRPRRQVPSEFPTPAARVAPDMDLRVSPNLEAAVVEADA